MRSKAEPRTGGGGRQPASIVLNRETCLTAWLSQFGHPPPKHVSVQFMRKALAYEIQVKHFGGHSKAVRRTLQVALKDSATARAGVSSKPALLRRGTHLVREWNGRSYQVEVLDEGFCMDGKTYRSLTAIARKITGAHWSGPRFFGVGSRS
ncbi:MAG: hypothetical protein Rhirs2KO_15810 [Rhizobiaceae bacterium]